MSVMYRRRALVGDGPKKEIQQWVDVLNASGEYPESSEVVIAVPSIYMESILATMRSDIAAAAQDVGISGNGAFTGETSAEMLLDLGVKWTLADHSERRAGYGGPGESSEQVAMKAKRAVDKGVNVIICVGEKLSDREAGNTMDVLTGMLGPCVEAMQVADWNQCVVAYEPVWAIGTGKVATPEVAEATHKEIRTWLAENVSPQVAEKMRIIYGGSAKKENCGSLIVCPNIDGFLVGGASLKPEFADMIKCTPGNM